MLATIPDGLIPSLRYDLALPLTASVDEVDALYGRFRDDWWSHGGEYEELRPRPFSG